MNPYINHRTGIYRQGIASLATSNPQYLRIDDVIHSSENKPPFENDGKTVLSSLNACINCIGSCGLKSQHAETNYINIDGMPLGTGCHGISGSKLINAFDRRPRTPTNPYAANCAGFIAEDMFDSTRSKRCYVRLVDITDEGRETVICKIQERILSIGGAKAIYKTMREAYAALKECIVEHLNDGFVIDTLERIGSKKIVKSIEMRRKIRGKYEPFQKGHTNWKEYENYCVETKRLRGADDIKKLDTFVESSCEQQEKILREKIIALGLEKILTDQYDSNVAMLLSSFFPDLTYRQFISI